MALVPAIGACTQTGGAGGSPAEGAVPDGTLADAGAGPQRPPDRRQADVREVPSAFATVGEVVWDGKPTLAGLWVAHPDTPVARRVRMWNRTVGTVVDGALLPHRGPSDSGMVISAEAAEALGVEPEVPAMLQLVAIEYDDEADGDAEEMLAALSAASPGPPAATVEAASATAPPATEPAVAEAVAAPASGAPEAAPSPDAAPAPVGIAAVSADPAAVAALATLVGSPPAAAAEPAPDAAVALPQQAPTAGVADPELAPLPPPASPASPDAPSAPAPDAPAAVAAAAPSVPVAEAPAADAAAPAPAMPAEPAPPIADGRPYVQAGYFAEPEHAADLVRTLAREGIPAANTEETVRGATLHRVRAGPFATAAARERALQKLRAIGIADAVAIAR